MNLKKFISDKIHKHIKSSENEIFNTIKDLEPNLMLIKSIQKGFMYGVQYAIENGANINYKPKDYKIDYPIIIAYKCNKIEIFEYLVNNGANLNVNANYLMKNIIYDGNIKLTKILLEHKVNPNILKDTEKRFSKKVSYEDIIEIIKLLISYTKK